MFRSLLKAGPSVRARLLLRHYATTRQTSVSINAAMSRTTEIFKTYKPITPGMRHLKRPLNEHVYPGRPIRALTIALRKSGGRNNQGRITIRGRGGGHRRRLRVVDFVRKDAGPQDVVRIEYDPGRSAHIALLRAREATANEGRRYSYIVAPDGLRAGAVIESFRAGIPAEIVPGFGGLKPGETLARLDMSNSEKSEGSISSQSSASLELGLLRAATIRVGNVLPLHLIPPGTTIHCITVHPDKKGILVRSAGTFGRVVLHEENGRYSQIRLQSGEVRKILQDCYATIGKVSNGLWKYRNLGKAGRKRWLGRRPHVRGVAMNRVDHPHGGGRGKSKGNKHPRSIWGWLTKGKRTRRPGPKGPKNSNKMVVRERPRGKEKKNL